MKRRTRIYYYDAHESQKRHNAPMTYSAADLGIEIDYRSDKPGAILQHLNQGKTNKDPETANASL